jgi:hypothetical protein
MFMNVHPHPCPLPGGEGQGESERQSILPSHPERLARRACWPVLFAALALLLALTFTALAQPKLMFESIRNYTAPEFFPAPDHTKLRTLVKGAVAEPAGTNSVLLKQVRIERFLLDGSRELLIEAPECVFHIESKEVTSAGPVSAKSGDDRYQLSGVGFRFLYRGTNSSLIISNNVRTTILGLGVDSLKP